MGKRGLSTTTQVKIGRIKSDKYTASISYQHMFILYWKPELVNTFLLCLCGDP